MITDRGTTEIVPRAIWSGSITFGLVNVPVRMLSAIAEKKLHFHYVHAPDSSRIGYEKVCKAEGKPVPDDEIVKAFEYEKGEYVYMTDEDFEAAAAESTKTIELRDFVAAGKSTRSTSSGRTTSPRRRARRRFTRSSSRRWSAPGSWRSRSTSCGTSRTSARCAFATA